MHTAAYNPARTVWLAQLYSAPNLQSRAYGGRTARSSTRPLLAGGQSNPSRAVSALLSGPYRGPMKAFLPCFTTCPAHACTSGLPRKGSSARIKCKKGIPLLLGRPFRFRTVLDRRSLRFLLIKKDHDGEGRHVPLGHQMQEEESTCTKELVLGSHLGAKTGM